MDAQGPLSLSVCPGDVNEARGQLRGAVCGPVGADFSLVILGEPHYSPSSGTGQLVALDLIYISGGRNEPEAGELRDLTAQYFIRFDPENPHSTARKQLIIRNAT